MKAKLTGWAGLICTLSATAVQAAHTSADRYSFVVFSVGAVAWMTNAMLTKNRPLLITNVFLFALDITAVIRWF